MIEFTLLPLCIEDDNNWKEKNDSFQLLSVSLERRRRVNSMIQLTRTVNLYFEVLTFRVTSIIEFTLLLLSVEADNNWKETNDSVQLLSAWLKRRRRVTSMIQVTGKVNPCFEVFTFRGAWIIEFSVLLLYIEDDINWKETHDSCQLLSASIERRRRVNSMI